jgi:DNA-binding CsgD family transcriptional regulator
MFHSRLAESGRNLACMAHPLQLRWLRLPQWPSRATSNLSYGELTRVVGPLEAACFEAHPDPQFALDERSEVVASNRAARELLDRANGPRALAEALLASAGDALYALGDAITAAIRDRTASATFELSISPQLCFAVRVVPLDPGFANALVTLRPLELRPLRRPSERFGFTPMESRVAELLCRGMKPSKIGRELGISIETVRTHLKQSFIKAGVHRQAELVAVMLGE